MALIDNLISYWKLDEISGTNAEDAHSTNDATASNAAVFTTEAAGIINTAADFRSQSYQVVTPNFLSTTNQTISFWFNAGTANRIGHEYMMTKATSWAFGNIDFAIRISSGNSIHVEARRYSTDEGVVLDSLVGGYNDNAWHHVVLIFIGDTGYFYLDNALQDSDTPSGQTLKSDGIYMGSRLTAIYFNGIVDEVGWWNTNKTSTEVTALWNDGNGLAYPFVVGTNMKINIGDVFKDIESLKINIGDAWKNVIKVQQNIGDVWKDVFG